MDDERVSEAYLHRQTTRVDDERVSDAYLHRQQEWTMRGVFEAGPHR